MTIKQNGGVFGRNPTFNDVTIEGDLILNGETFTGLDFNGSWNASTNSPTLSSGTGTQGEFYIVSVAGTTNLDGVTNWGVGDYCFFNGTAWQRIEGGADGNFVNLSASGTSTLAAVNCANITSTGTINMNSDSATLFFGADIDMRILHDGSNGTFRNDTGNLTMDIAGFLDIDVDNGSVYFSDGGVTFGQIFGTGSHLNIKSTIGDKDIIFQGVDGSSAITALTLDMSDSGKATFNNGASFSHDVTIDADGRALRIGASQDLALFHSSDDSTIRSSTGDLILSNTASNKDIIFKGNDGGSTITALTLDMSNAGAATFNGTIITSTSGTSNLRLGNNAGNSITSGARNVLVGDDAGDALTSGYNNVAIGQGALGGDTQGQQSIAIGRNALLAQNFTSGTDAYNVAVGASAGAAITTGLSNTIVGGLAGDALTDADANVAIGTFALGTCQLGSRNIAIGASALLRCNPAAAADMHNIAIGTNAGEFISTGIKNVLIGGSAGDAITTGSGNTAIGYDAGGLTTGTDNTLIGHAAGNLITSGSDNVVIGNYDGNEGGLDIRTSNGNIVLSDGDGNIRIVVNNSGNSLFGCTALPTGSAAGFAFTADQFYTSTTSTSANTQVRFYNGNGLVGNITTDGSSTSFNTSSDHRLKENVVALSDATTRLKQLSPKRFNFIADADTTVDGFLAHEVQSVVPEAITGTHNEVDSENNPVYQGIDQSKLVPLLVATIQELEARITALEGE